MAVTRVTLHRAAFIALRKSPEVVGDLERRGRAIANNAGTGFEAETFTGRARGRVTVRAATFEAKRAEATSRALTAAIDAGR